MRLQVFSDLHLESGPFEPVLANPDVVVLAGDVHEGTEGVKWAKRWLRDFPVIYVLGNHEYYNHRLSDLVKKLKREARGSQVHVLENDVFEWKGYSFLGCTLWTDFNLGPADARDAMFFAWGQIADYQLIKKDGTGALLHPAETARMHAKSVHWLERQMASHDPDRTIVVTHHAPSPRSIPTYHAGEELSAAFASNLDSFIHASRVPLWIHGHTHHNVDYKLGATRICSNQRGYAFAQARNFEAGKIITLL
jgi:Icc-related predicted phosphoesterase